MRQRGTTLLEVLVAVTLLTLVFLTVSQDMLATVGAQAGAGANSTAVSEANYLMSQVQGDPGFWPHTDWSAYAPSLNNCQYPPMNGTYTKPLPQASDGNAWQALPAGCGGSDNLRFMWAATQELSDAYAADVAIWVKTNQGVYELHGIRSNVPSQGFLPTPGTIQTLTPSPTPTPTPTPSMPATPTPSPKPKPSPTAKPSPTPTPPPTPTPQPTVGV